MDGLRRRKTRNGVTELCVMVVVVVAVGPGSPVANWSSRLDAA